MGLKGLRRQLKPFSFQFGHVPERVYVQVVASIVPVFLLSRQHSSLTRPNPSSFRSNALALDLVDILTQDDIDLLMGSLRQDAAEYWHERSALAWN